MRTLNGCLARISRPLVRSTPPAGSLIVVPASMLEPTLQQQAQRLGSSKNFEHARRAHAAADAHRDDDALGAAALAFDQRVAGQALTRHAVRVANRDRTAVD